LASDLLSQANHPGWVYNDALTKRRSNQVTNEQQNHLLYGWREQELPA
jgi:hypothetical protein